jgi:hypothetical protein
MGLNRALIARDWLEVGWAGLYGQYFGLRLDYILSPGRKKTEEEHGASISNL